MTAALLLVPAAHCKTRLDINESRDSSSKNLVPTESTKPEALKRAEIKLLPELSSCDSSFTAEADASGILYVAFDELLSEASSGKYNASCRLAGELLIPRGYRLNPEVSLSGLVKGELHGPLDNVTGRLKFGLGHSVTRDFQLVQFKIDAEGNNNGLQPNPPDPVPTQYIKMDLKAVVPQLLARCEGDTSLDVSLYIESTINGRAFSRIESLQLDPLELVEANCPSELPKP